MANWILLLLGRAIGTMPTGFDRAMAGKLSALGFDFEDLIQEGDDRWIAKFRQKSGREFARLGARPDLKLALHAIFDPLKIDFFLLPESTYFSRRKLVAFDLDSTLIDAEGIDEFARELGVYEKVAAITERAMRGEIEFNQSFSERVACLKGLTQTQIEAVRMRVKLHPGAVKLLNAIEKYGARAIILSGGFDALASLVRAKAPVAWTVTNRLEMIDGVCTGNFIPPVIDGAGKAENLQKKMTELGIFPEEVLAIGDGSNDLAMLGVAGIGVSYRGKPKLNEAADGVLNDPDLSQLSALLT